ncbi:MAG: hypothetical protein WAP23_03480 [Candidatus Spechtbacterales bacterium]
MIQEAAEFMGKHILFFLPQSTSGTMEHPWDYVAHFIVSFAGVGILFTALFFLLKALGVQPGAQQKIAIFTGAGIMLVIGIIKEINDKNLGKTDMAGDMLADILGILAALLLAFLVIKILH